MTIQSSIDVEQAPVSAEALTVGDETHDDFPTIELTSVAELQVLEAVDVSSLRDDDQVPDTEMTVAQPVASSIRDRDVEGGFSTRVLTSSRYNRAEFVSASFQTTSSSTHLGLIMDRDEPIITSIGDNSLVSSSPLSIGNRIISVNNKNCKSMSGKSVGRLLQTRKGNFTIVAHNEGGSPDLLETMVTKSNPNQKCGIAFKRNRENKLEIRKIYPDRMFARSLLNVGDLVLSINGVPCENMEATVAANMVRSTEEKTITIVAKTLNSTGVVLSEVSGRSIRPLQGQPSTNENQIVVTTEHNNRSIVSCQLITCLLVALLFITEVVVIFYLESD